MRRAPFFVLGLWAAACASTPKPAVETETAAPAATPGEDELAKAWAPEAEPAKPAAAPAQRLEQPPPPADRRIAFRDAIDQANAALAGKQLDAAQSAAATAVREAASLGADERAKAGQLSFKAAHAADDVAAAKAAALAWRLACGPDGLDACRNAATSALATVGKMKGADASIAKLAKELKEADACAATAERAGNGPSCLGDAERLAARFKDKLLAARVLLGHALAEKNDAKKAQLLEKAEAKCGEAQCAGVRRRALAKLIALDLAANDVERAVRHALRDQQVHASTVEPETKLWARTAELEKLCAKYDATAGAGACRKLEKQENGELTFRDFSKDKGGGREGLSPDQVRQVNEHYAPLLQDCLTEQARRMTPPDAQRYEVRWVVGADGRVQEAHLRKDMDDNELAKCLRRQFVHWRYPRFEGELQHVEQAFTVTAIERRSAVR